MNELSAAQEEPSPIPKSRDRAARILSFAAFGCLLVLMLLTWRLWLPERDFPRVPFFVAGVFPSDAVNYVALIVLALGGVGAFVGLFGSGQRRLVKVGIGLVAFGAFVLIAGDQQRLQPWLPHLLAVLALYVLARNPQPFVRWLTLGIYLHSAVSKLDYSFLMQHGVYLLNGLLSVFHMDAQRWPPNLVFAGVLLFPVGELVVVVLLSRTRWRRIGWRLAALMHVGLLLTLGPLGLKHAAPVLVWNAFFLVQALVMQAADLKLSPRPVTGVPATGGYIPGALVALLIGLPVLNWEPFHLYDHWPAWSLYSSRGERLAVDIHDHAVDRLDPKIQQHLADPLPLSPWRQLRLDRWALASTNAPLYPEERLRLSVAIAIARQYDLQDSIRIRLQSVANRWNGDRSTIELNGIEEIQQHAERFWLNTQSEQQR